MLFHIGVLQTIYDANLVMLTPSWLHVSPVVELLRAQKGPDTANWGRSK